MAIKEMETKMKMKRLFTCLLLITAVILLTACFWQKDDNEKNYAKASGFTATPEAELTDVNLDDSGGNDDKVVASYYETQDGKHSSFSLIEVYLGSGKYVSQIYQGYCQPKLYAADFSGNGTEEIVVALGARSSSYNSTDIHVLGVSFDKDNKPELTEYLTILDGSKDGRAQAVFTYKNSLLTITNSGALNNTLYPDMTDFCSGAATYQPEGSKTAYLIVYHRKNSAEQTGYSLLSWNGTQWSVVKQGFQAKQ
jgi:hypothetical protein